MKEFMCFAISATWLFSWLLPHTCNANPNILLLTIPPVIAAARTPIGPLPGNMCSDQNLTVLWKGREWQRSAVDWNEQRHNWEGAKNYCQNLALCNFSDWRLPTKDELKSLVVCTNGHPVPLEDNTWCSADGSGFDSPTIDSSFLCWANVYWSSSEYDMDKAWYVGFESGVSFWADKNNVQFVRCIRE